MERIFTTNSRLVNELFANYVSTFVALCELINNSIQASAKNIWLDIDYTSDEEINPLIIKKIVVKDDGYGVYVTDLENKILDIGTNNKDGGKGIGRFAAFQLGKTITIETIGYSQENKNYSKVILPLSFDSFGKNINVSEVKIKTQEEILEGQKHNTYYKVTIEDLYDIDVTDKEPKKKIVEKMLRQNIADAIFERYPLKIFNKEVNFYINKQKIEPSTFVIGTPSLKNILYQDRKGQEHYVQFRFFNVKSLEKRKVFLTTNNAGIQTIASGFEYDAEWLSPRIGGWFIYVSSDSLSADIYRNIGLDELDEEVKYFKSFIKEQLTIFFRKKNVEFDNFIDKLKKDSYYPYKEKSSSKSKTILFDKLAFLVEDKYNLLNEQNRLREIIYPLIDRTISNGELDQILNSILKLNKKTITKFNELLNRTELENIIAFSDKVSLKMEELEFIEKLTYSEISKHLKERKELHKFLEKMLWIFGEEFNDSTKLLSDKGLENNLKTLREDIMKYKASKKDDNINTNVDKSTKSITDLFMYSEKIIDCNKREVLIVELKAPKVKISPVELAQAKRYAREIEQSGQTPQHVNFKVLLISSDISDAGKYEIKGEENNPYLYFRSNSGKVEVWVMKWSDLLERQKRKLKYLSNSLEIKDVDIQSKVAKDFEDIDFQRTSSTLRQVNI
ncbi:MAG: ATP-binding protein [Bacteroidales bacterium]|nr:ATP-binding protein [Bacteroidales bacterium]